MSNRVGGNDLAAELLLNKIMNGQVKTESGKTVTAGSRAKASELNRQAVAPSIASANVKAGIASAVQIQTHLTEGKAYLENLDKALADTTQVSAKKLATDAKKYMGNFLNLEVDGIKVFEDTANTIDVSLGFGDTLTLGDIDFDSVHAAALVTSLDALIATTPATTEADLATAVKNVRDDLEAAIATANSNLGLTGMQVQTLEGRSAVLDDLSATFTDAASQQFVVGTGGAEDLLGNVLN
jgi:hypothetical protein